MKKILFSLMAVVLLSISGGSAFALTNGACGGDDLMYIAHEPPTVPRVLCIAGTASTPSYAGSPTYVWSWDCVGIDGGTTDSPQKVITGMSTAMQNGDISGALAYVGKASQAKVGAALRKMDTSARLRLAIAVLGAKKVVESGNRIVYKGTIILPNGQKIEETFEIITEDGIWKLASL